MLQNTEMSEISLYSITLNAWQRVCCYIASGHADEFSGQRKETVVFRRFRAEIEQNNPSRGVRITGPDKQAKFQNWNIDLVCEDMHERLTIEGKYKLLRDGAVPDNRKAAFFDLYKLEQYVASGEYSKGLFLWLTDNPNYLLPATGDSSDFSTHDGRIYESGTQLMAERRRNVSLPLPLSLVGRYVFHWQRVLPDSNWQTLVLCVSCAG